MSAAATVDDAVDTVSDLAAVALALRDRKGSKASKVLGVFMLGQTIYKTVIKYRTVRRSERDYTISVPSDDDIYPDLNDWLLTRLQPSERKALTARSSRRRSDDNQMPVAEDGERPAATMRLFYDGRSQQKVVIEGHVITVTLDEPGNSGNREDRDYQRWSLRERMIFTCPGEEARDALLAVFDDLVANLTELRKPRVFMARQWGGWQNCSDVPSRNLDSVVLPPGVKDMLVADLQSFLDNETAYVKLGMPYHRSYLFYGVPGTGKTSLAKALATHFGLDLRYIALSVIDSDQALMETLVQLGPRSMLLLEDIDIAHASHERDDTAKGVTLSGLLNGLDGVITPHGLITVMTTNNREILDPALVRPGRVDVELELGHVDDRQLAELAAIIGVPADFPPINGRLITPAQVVGVLKQGITDPYAASAALAAWLEE